MRSFRTLRIALWLLKVCTASWEFRLGFCVCWVYINHLLDNLEAGKRNFIYYLLFCHTQWITSRIKTIINRLINIKFKICTLLGRSDCGGEISEKPSLWGIEISQKYYWNYYYWNIIVLEKKPGKSFEFCIQKSMRIPVIVSFYSNS